MALPTEVTTYSELAAAVAAGKNIIITASITLEANVSIGGEVTFVKGGKITTNSYLLIIYSVLNAGPIHIFEGDGVIISRKSAMVFYPEWWGCFGDGINEDTTAMRHATTVAADSRVPLWCAQSYLVNEIKIKTGMTLRGRGTFKAKDGIGSYVISCDGDETSIQDVDIQDIKINGNKGNRTAGGCLHVGGTNITVKNIYAYDAPNACINVALGTNIKILDNTCMNAGLANNSWGMIAICGGTDVIVDRNITKCTDGKSVYGICVEPNSGSLSSKVGKTVISNNIIRGGRLFVNGNEIVDGSLNGVTLINNDVDARGSKSTGLDSTDSPIYLRNTSQLTVKNNRTWNRGPTGSTVVMAINVDQDNTDFNISNNDFLIESPDITSFALRFMTSGNKFGIISGNLIYTFGAHPLTYGFYSYSSLEANCVSVTMDNRLVWGGPGISEDLVYMVD